MKHSNQKGIPKKAHPTTSPEILTTTKDIFSKHPFAITITLIGIIGFMILKDYLLFEKIFLFKDIGSDTLNGSYPPMYHTAEYFHKYGLPSWSFAYGMGVNILPLCLRDPFDALLYIAGKDSIVYLIPWKEYLKIILGGIIFFKYLQLILKDPFTWILGSVLFAFSGFFIVGGCWYIFSYEAVNVALMLLGFELLFQRGKWLILTLSFTFMGIAQPFNLYVYGIFLAIYAAIRYFENPENKKIGPLFPFYLKMAGCSILAIGLSALFLIPNIVQLIESPRGSGESSYTNLLQGKSILGFENAVHYQTFLSRLFSNDLRGTGINFQGWQNYLEAPLVYGGLILLCVFSQIFFLPSKRMKIVYLIFISVFIIPVIFPYFRYAFWLFTGDYYRAFSFFITLSLLYVGLKIIQQIITKQIPVNSTALWIGSGILILALAGTTLDALKGKPVFIFSIVFLILYALTLQMIKNTPATKYIKVILLTLVCMEAWYMGYIPTHERKMVTASELKQRIGYNDYSLDAISYLHKIDPGFFRVDKNYFSSPAMHGSLNDGMAQGYFGTSSYHSFNQLNYINFCKFTGIIQPGNELQTRWVNGLMGRPILEDICSVKYLLLKNVGDNSWNTMYDSIAQFSDVKVLKGKYALPLGFTYNSYRTKSSYAKIKKSMQDIALLRAPVVEDSDSLLFSSIIKYSEADSNEVYTVEKLAADHAERLKDTLAITNFLPAFISGKITLSADKILFLSIPFDKSWSASVNGTPVPILKLDDGLSGLYLIKGCNLVELSFTSRYASASKWISGLSMLLLLGLTWIKPKI